MPGVSEYMDTILGPFPRGGGNSLGQLSACARELQGGPLFREEEKEVVREGG